MNLRPPPSTNNLAELRSWCEELYKFLQFPVFQTVRLLPRSEPTSDDQTVDGVMYQDSTDHKLKVHNATDFQDTY